MYPAYFVVNTYENGDKKLEEFDALYSANAKKIEGSALSSQGFNTSLPSTISISDLLDIVNETHSDILPQSVADHYGNQRRQTKLGESVKYSLPDESSIMDYAADHETEFVDVPPVRDYERRARGAKQQTYNELRAQMDNGMGCFRSKNTAKARLPLNKSQPDLLPEESKATTNGIFKY